MATTPKELIDGVLLTDSLATLYTVPTNTTAKLYELILHNTDTSNAIGVTLHLIQSGDTAADKNKIFSEEGEILAATETKIIGMEQRLSRRPIHTHGERGSGLYINGAGAVVLFRYARRRKEMVR